MLITKLTLFILISITLLLDYFYHIPKELRFFFNKLNSKDYQVIEYQDYEYHQAKEDIYDDNYIAFTLSNNVITFHINNKEVNIQKSRNKLKIKQNEIFDEIIDRLNSLSDESKSSARYFLLVKNI